MYRSAVPGLNGMHCLEQSLGGIRDEWEGGGAHKSASVFSPSSPETRSTSSNCTIGLNSAWHSSSVSPVPSSGGVVSSGFSAWLLDAAAPTPLNPPNPVPAPKVDADPNTGDGDEACAIRWDVLLTAEARTLLMHAGKYKIKTLDMPQFSRQISTYKFDTINCPHCRKMLICMCESESKSIVQALNFTEKRIEVFSWMLKQLSSCMSPGSGPSEGQHLDLFSLAVLRHSGRLLWKNWSVSNAM